MSNNYLMGYNTFISTPDQVSVPHPSLTLKEMIYPRSADKLHFLAHETRLILHVFMYVILYITSQRQRRI